MMGELTEEQMDALIGAAMVNGGIFKDHHFTVHKWEQSLFESIIKNASIGAAPLGAIASFIYPIAKDLSHIFDMYDEIINDWDIRSELEKSNTVNMLMHALLDGSSANNSRVWDILTAEQAETVAQALPVVIWFALNYASRDYNDTDDDDGMWGVGTFVNNASVIISNHYQEVSLAWVRSYDDFYNNDLQAYTLDTANIVNDAPTGSYASSTKTLTLTGQEGSSIFYSIDGGNSWSSYMAPVDFEETPDEILCFSIYRGVKSEVNEVSLNAWTGSILGGGNVWFLIAGAVLVVGACVAAVEINRKKKKAAASSN
jgi:hypothetical protein